MTKAMTRDIQPKQLAKPWGSAAALLAACLTTLAGVARGIDPEVILWRAGVTAMFVGTVTAVAVCVAAWLKRQKSGGVRSQDSEYLVTSDF
jgi:hypothetical protein